MSELPIESDRARAELPPLGDALEFLRLIWAVDHALQRRSKSMAVTLGITGPQRLVLRIVGRFPSVHGRPLAATLHLHPSSLTALLKRLERRGLIRRRPDGRDRRRLLLGLTRRGQALNHDTPGTIEEAVQQTLDTISRRDLEGARVTLARLARALEGTDAVVPQRHRRRSRVTKGRAR